MLRGQLQDALEEAFFNGEPLPLRVKFTAKNYLKKVANAKGASDQRQDALLPPDSALPDTIRRAQSPARDASEDPSHREIPPRTRRGGCTAEEVAEDGEEPTASRTPKAGAANSTGGATPPGGIGGSTERFGVSARQRDGDMNGVRDDDEVDLAKLARRWLDLKPGGSFARHQPQQRRRRNIDVLKWDV